MDNQGIRVDLKEFERGNLKAFADVTIPSALGELTLKGFRVICKDGAAPWVGFPTSSYTKDVKIVNKPVLELASGVKRQISEAVLAEFARATRRT